MSNLRNPVTKLSLSNPCKVKSLKPITYSQPKLTSPVKKGS